MDELLSKQAFLNNLLKDLSADQELRLKFVENPKAVLERRLNFKLPENFEVIVHQDSRSKYNLVLPFTEELSEAELLAVSGGSCWSYVGSCPTDVSGCSVDYSDLKLKKNIHALFK